MERTFPRQIQSMYSLALSPRRTWKCDAQRSLGVFPQNNKLQNVVLLSLSVETAWSSHRTLCILRFIVFLCCVISFSPRCPALSLLLHINSYVFALDFLDCNIYVPDLNWKYYMLCVYFIWNNPCESTRMSNSSSAHGKHEQRVLEMDLSFSPSSAPQFLWNYYVEYLWNYKSHSLVAKIGYTFRVLALVLLLPIMILILIVRSNSLFEGVHAEL